MNYHYHHFFLFRRTFSTFSNFFFNYNDKKRGIKTTKNRNCTWMNRRIFYWNYYRREIKRRHLKGHLIIKLASGEQHANSKWHEEEKWNRKKWLWIQSNVMPFHEISRYFLTPLPKSNSVTHQIFLQNQSNYINF